LHQALLTGQVQRPNGDEHRAFIQQSKRPGQHAPVAGIDALLKEKITRLILERRHLLASFPPQSIHVPLQVKRDHAIVHGIDFVELVQGVVQQLDLLREVQLLQERQLLVHGLQPHNLAAAAAGAQGQGEIHEQAGLGARHAEGEHHRPGLEPVQLFP
jgi:hypothetical protein